MATGRRDQLRTFEFVPMQLREPEHCVGEQRRLRVFEPVVRRVEGGILQPVGGRQIDDAPHRSDELRRQFHRAVVGKPEEHQVEPGGRGRLECRVAQGRVGQFERRVQSAARLPAMVSPVASTSSNSGCDAINRMSSAPVYPDAPMTPTRIAICMSIRPAA